MTPLQTPYCYARPCAYSLAGLEIGVAYTHPDDGVFSILLDNRWGTDANLWAVLAELTAAVLKKFEGMRTEGSAAMNESKTMTAEEEARRAADAAYDELRQIIGDPNVSPEDARKALARHFLAAMPAVADAPTSYAQGVDPEKLRAGLASMVAEQRSTGKPRKRRATKVGDGLTLSDGLDELRFGDVLVDDKTGMPWGTVMSGGLGLPLIDEHLAAANAAAAPAAPKPKTPGQEIAERFIREGHEDNEIIVYAPDDDADRMRLSALYGSRDFNLKHLRRFVAAMIDQATASSRGAAAASECANAHDYLARLLEAVSPGIEVKPDLMGLCTQVEHVIAGLKGECDGLRRSREKWADEARAARIACENAAKVAGEERSENDHLRQRVAALTADLEASTILLEQIGAVRLARGDDLTIVVKPGTDDHCRLRAASNRVTLLSAGAAPEKFDLPFNWIYTGETRYPAIDEYFVQDGKICFCNPSSFQHVAATAPRPIVRLAS